MSEHDPIGEDIVDAYRSERAPAGFADAVMREARARSAPRFPLLRFGIPAAAVALLVMLISTGTFAPRRDRADLVAISFASMPAGIPTLSDVDALRLTSVASLGVLPRAPTMNLNLPALSRLRSAARNSAPSATNTQ